MQEQPRTLLLLKWHSSPSAALPIVSYLITSSVMYGFKAVDLVSYDNYQSIRYFLYYIIVFSVLFCPVTRISFVLVVCFVR